MKKILFIIIISLLLISCNKDKIEKKQGIYYVLGGSIKHGHQTSLVQLIDFNEKTVTEARWQLPLLVENGNAIIINDTLYFLQGLGSFNIYYKNFDKLFNDYPVGNLNYKNAPLNTNFKIDLSSGNVSILAVFPNYSYGEGSAVELINDCIYRIGATGSFGDNYCFHIKNESWIKKSPFPRGYEYGIHGITPDKNILVCGGNNDGVTKKDCFEYLVENDTWVQRPSLPYAAGLSAFVQKDNIIHIIGGYIQIKTGTPYVLLDTYLLYNLSNYNITEGPNFPKKIQSGVATFYKDTLYIIGGTTNVNAHYGLDAVEIWSLKNGNWTKEDFELLQPTSIPARGDELLI